ncbi:MAG TPA: IniB N-terminal domain-containing protein [Pseudonocardiaceae bacterium]|nr:IniB N-terminal domain-containing protein [Pseudonocardiaceae bacterium]
MEQADQTLHDFVLNLLSDSQALAAFEQDPATMLDHAGLSDISAADVQEVIPLVIDYVPTHADALDAVLSQLPVDSLDTGQLGAIQQLQFVTQALGGMPALDVAGALGNDNMTGAMHVAAGSNGVLAAGDLISPMGENFGQVAGDLEHGLTVTLADNGMAGTGSSVFTVPGLDAVPGVGGGLPSGFSSLSDVTDVLDGHATSMTSSLGTMSTTASNLVTGAAELTAGALANPTALAGALSDPAGTVTALTGTADSYAMYATQALPAPANEAVGQAVQQVTSTSQSLVSGVSDNVHTGPLGGVAGNLPTSDVTHALGPVQGVLGQVTGSVADPTQALGTVTHDVTGTLSDPTHALTDPTSAVSTVQSTVSDTVGSVASHSAVSDVTGSTGAGSLLGSADHGDVTGDLSHVTSDLHLPSLF